MPKNTIYKSLAILCLALILDSCGVPKVAQRKENTSVPSGYNGGSKDTLNSGKLKWREFFGDPYLSALIDSALKNNQELNITLQEISVARNEIRIRKGEYLPFVGLRGGAGFEKVGRYTNIGTLEANTPIINGKETPDPLPDYQLTAYASWEIDIWHKLRNARKSAVARYLSTVEGKNFMITNLISEVARSYYELLALDNQLDIVNSNIKIQGDALDIVKLQKESARVTELAVRRFEAQVLHTKSLQYNIQQRIIVTENRINFLLGRFPAPVPRNDQAFNDLTPKVVRAGLPSQLLANRPDIRQAEQDLAAAKLDVKVARARFYPSLGISAVIGYQAFNPSYLVKLPQSLLYSMLGDITGPLINRNAIKGLYYGANARQLQSVFNYERTILNAYIQVANQLSNISNLEKEYNLQSQQVDALMLSTSISTDLFRSARADYMEVLLTQRDALEARFDLVETKIQRLNAVVNMYQALGGGGN